MNKPTENHFPWIHYNSDDPKSTRAMFEEISMQYDISLVIDASGTFFASRLLKSTSEDIRREMAKVYRETRCNKIMPSNGTKLVYMLISILRAYEASEMEQRLTDLELAHLESAI